MVTQNERPVKRFTSPTDAAEFIHACVAKAHRSIDLFSHHLTPGLYSGEALVDAVSALARSGAQCKVRILIRDSRPLHGTRHPLLLLAQRLPSHIEVKVLAEDLAKLNIAYLIVDQAHVVYFNDEANSQGFISEDARAEAQSLLEAFDPMWESNTKDDPNLRKLSM